MQKILSSFVLREYRQYSPEQLQFFRKSASLSKQRNMQSFTQKMPATKQSEQSEDMIQNHIQVTQFQVHKNQLDQLGDAVTKIETKIENILNSQRIITQQKFDDKIMPQMINNEVIHKQEILITQQPQEVVKQQNNKKQAQKRNYLKVYRQKLQSQTMNSSRKNGNKFNLKQFKNKLNYTMYNKIC